MAKWLAVMVITLLTSVLGAAGGTGGLKWGSSMSAQWVTTAGAMPTIKAVNIWRPPYRM